MRTDAELVMLTRNGDRSAFGELIRRYQGLIYGLACHQVGDFTDAQDVAQEAFIRAYRSLDQLEQPERFGAWLKSITANESRMHLRSRQSTVSLEDAEAMPSYASVVEERRLMGEYQAGIRNAIDSLPEKSRLLVTLHYLSGLSCEEIGQSLGMASNAVRQHLYRARRQLKEMLMAEIEEGYAMNRLPEGFAESVLRRVTLFPVREGEFGSILGEGDTCAWVMGVDGDGSGRSLIALAMRRDDLDAVIPGFHPMGDRESAKAHALESMFRTHSAFGIEVRQVVLRLTDSGQCLARVDLRQGDVEHALDMRPSDALGLAVRTKASIYAEEPVIRAQYVGEDGLSVRLEDHALDELRSEFQARTEFEAIVSRAWELGLSPDDWIDTVRVRRDGSGARMWLEASPDREASIDGEESGLGLAMIFDYASRRLKTSAPKHGGRGYTVHFSMLNEDARMRFVPDPTE